MDGLGNLESRIREPQAIGRRAHSETQQQAFGSDAILLHGQRRTQRFAHLLVEEHRVLVRALWKQAFRQPGDEDDAECSSSRLLRAADEDAPVALTRGFDLQRQEAIGHDVAGFVERDRTDRAHGPQLGEHAQNPLGTPHHVGYERRESIEPFTPGRRRRPRREPVDHG